MLSKEKIYLNLIRKTVENANGDQNLIYTFSCKMCHFLKGFKKVCFISGHHLKLKSESL